MAREWHLWTMNRTIVQLHQQYLYKCLVLAPIAAYELIYLI